MTLLKLVAAKYDEEESEEEKGEKKEFSEVDETMPAKKNILTSSADPDVIIELNIEHCMLDAIARLLARELNLNWKGAGSVSVALINDHGHDKLAIALKYTRNDVEPVIKALNNIVIYSRKLATMYPDYKTFIRKKKQIIKDADMAIKSSDEPLRDMYILRIGARQEIDKIRFNKFLTTNSTTTVQARIKRLFVDGLNLNNVILVDNTLNYHSEIAMTEFLLNGQFKLETCTKSQRSYQYIGNSIKICSKCNAILNGGDGVKGYNKHESLLIFFRGSYDVGYPNYMVPERSLKLNHCSPLDMVYRLDKLGIPSKTISKNELILRENVDVSEGE